MNPLALLNARHLAICGQIGGDGAVTMWLQVVTPSSHTPITSWPGQFRRIAVQNYSSATEASARPQRARITSRDTRVVKRLGGGSRMA